MPITLPTPSPKDTVFIQRSDNNEFYGEAHISGSDLILYIDNDGHINADDSSSFYSAYPPVTVGLTTELIVTASALIVTMSFVNGLLVSVI
jgi:hypothetical protein